MKKILICSAAIPNVIEEKIIYNSSAANRFIHNLANNIEGYSVNYFSYLSYPTSDEEKKIILDSIKETDNFQIFFKCKHLFTSIKILVALLNHIKSADIILVYNMNFIFWMVSFLSRILKKKHGIIIADYTEPKEIKSSIRKLYQKLNWVFIMRFKKIIVLSSELKCKITNSLLFEGAVDSYIYDNITRPEKHNKLVCYYGGVLDYVTGIDRMLKVFDRLRDYNIHFVISGKGALANKVSEYDRRYSNFEYVGYVSFEQYINLLNEASILLNLRNMNMPQNKNNFPSKFFDFLASGRVIISTKFPGYNYYLDNAAFVDNSLSLDTDIDSIAEALIDKINITQEEIDSQFHLNRKKAINLFWNKRVDDIISYIMKED